MINPPCEQCAAVCCKQRGNHTVSVHLRPHETDYRSVETHDGLGVVRAIPLVDGACFYLKDNKCSIYDTRPVACREFNCSHGYPGRISFFLEDNPDVLELIQLTMRQKTEEVLAPSSEKSV